MYRRDSVDVLRRKVSLMTRDDCISFSPCGKEYNVNNRNHLMKVQYFKRIYEFSKMDCDE